jgi:hypothetical protein
LTLQHNPGGKEIYKMNIEKEMCESATGIRSQKTLGKLYDDKGNEIAITEARRIFRKGETVEVPNAGAGSFREVLKLLGYKKIDVYEWCSSAGDWTFKVKGHYVCQENRYPYFGFRYSLCLES